MVPTRQIGYARVSTQQQDTSLQMAAFRNFGVRRVVEEKRSGKGERPKLEKLLRELRPGAVLLVYKIDRLARSLTDLLRILDRVVKAGATFKSLTEPLETQTPVGRMMIQLLGAVAEFEREVIRERCAAGRAAARAKGILPGRPVTLDRAQVIALRAQGHGVAQIARDLGFAASSIYKALKGVRVCDGGPGEHCAAPGQTFH
jgi:DNA invertase Pin-like site-specific DNA recombinase